MSKFDFTPQAKDVRNGTLVEKGDPEYGAAEVDPNRMTEDEFFLLNFVEEFYWKEGKFPPKKAIDDEFYYSTGRGRKGRGKWTAEALSRTFQKPAVQKSLKARGFEDGHFTEVLTKISAQEPVEQVESKLSPIQLLAANMMLNLHDARSEREKLKELGISSQKWHAWLRDPNFSNYLRVRAESLYSSSDHIAYSSLIKAIKSGDFQATKFFFEMRGIYNPKLEVQVNIEHVMTRVVEIISTHVQDPVVLEAIADSLSEIEG